MTVLIAAADPLGARASEALADLDEPVVHVETEADALERVDDASAVVLGELAEGSPASVRRAAWGPLTVGLGVEATVELSAEATVEEVRAAVAEVRRAGDYRAAVDDLYERCRDLAREGEEVPPDSVAEARERAEVAFEAVRDAEQLSYSDLLDED